MALPLLESLEDLAPSLNKAPRVWLGLDYDGTLTRHVDDPRTAAMPRRVHESLEALVQRERLSVAIISGRSLDDLAGRVPHQGLARAGNHGLEIVAAGLEFQDEDALRARPALQAALVIVRQRLSHIPGLSIQDKRLTLAVDYRGSRAEHRDQAREVLQALEQRVPGLNIRVGEHGGEVRPRTSSHKGTAAAMLRQHQAGPDSLPVFIGDDRTDEDAFAALPDGITIRVGTSPTLARYFVPEPEQVWHFLDWLRDRI